MKVIPEQKSHVLLESVKKSYTNRPVLKGLDLSIKKGEFVAIVGKSGCGKSTLLRLIAGLEGVNEGSIYINDNELNHLNEQARIMFQDGRLLPWKKVFDNVCIGLPKDAKEKVVQALKQVGLEERMDDYPAKLSGGQQQRVALARALVHDPSLLLLDEPLGALDALTRIEMQDLIEALWKKNNFTSILVTHDVEEAVSLADRVVLIENGTISLDQVIHLPRPRQRSHPAFTMYIEEILGRIMEHKQAKDFVM
ncbi:ATP-binding cassette domain-containing protein [Lentibacillus daqui]|uniref:ATP-binding cassette domain-containing protein n=1 Tax=Lentibacillus daqui TaxID=2911514 RepID=UPI003F72FCF9